MHKQEKNPKGKIPTPDDLFCHDLPTNPLPFLGRILVTGASGYIGGRLIPELIARGYRVRAMVRGASSVYRKMWPEVEVVVADALLPRTLEKALEGVDTAYYLIHSLYLGPKEFEAADIKAAANFRLVAEEKGIRGIIYLGGLGDISSPLSSHLRNRMEVAEELKQGTVPVTILRAAIIIGSGSASYEIIEHLIRRLAIMPVPRWAQNNCQPISIRDVIKYLVGVLEIPESVGLSFSIGGKEILTYLEMLKIFSEILNKKTIYFNCPISSIKFYAYLASQITPVPNAITQCLMEGLKDKVICEDMAIKSILPFEPVSYRQALLNAMTREQQDRVSTRWSDAFPPAHELALKLHELRGRERFKAKFAIFSEKSATSIFKSICRIGGKEGWLYNTWMWRLRGAVDRLFAGVGTSRGRKSYGHLQINDVIDFWRIEDIRPNKRLLLRSEMKTLRRAWLEFSVRERGGRRKITLRAYYDPLTIMGRFYWYMILPFHNLIFKNLLKEIDKKS
ncbi:MAG: SDR family oxidoreductase [candidate division Zixibacteria bacterium]